MNIKDSYIHNGVAVLKDIQVSGNELLKKLAGKNASDNYLDWVKVLTLTDYNPLLNGNTHATGASTIYAATVPGTANYLLQSNGSGAPSWTNNISIANITSSGITSLLKVTLNTTYSTNNVTNWAVKSNANGELYALKSLMSKTITNITNGNTSYPFYMFINLVPTDNTNMWHIKYNVRCMAHTTAGADTTFNGEYEVEFWGYGRTICGNKIWNSLRNYPLYQHYVFYSRNDTYDLTYGWAFGVYFNNYSTEVNAYPRTFEIDILEYNGCTVEFLTPDSSSTTPYRYDSDFVKNINGTSTKFNLNTYLAAYGGYNATSNGLQESGDANDITTIYEYYTRPYTGAGGALQYSLIMQDANHNWNSFTTTQGAGTKTKNANGFLLNSKIFYYGSSGLTAANSLIGGYGRFCSNTALLDLRYSLNIGANSATKGLLAYKPVFIVGTLGTDGLFYLDDTWWTQTIPTTEDGKIYIRIAVAVYPDYGSSAGYWTTNNEAVQYRADFNQSDVQTFWYHNGSFREYSIAARLSTDAGSTTLPIYFNNGIPTAITGAIANNTTGTAAAISGLTANDNASSSTDWRKVWFSYADAVTGRPALSTNLTFQTSTGTLKATNFSGNLTGNVTGNVTGDITGNADTVDSHHALNLFLYTKSASGTLAASSITGDYWYATITTDRSYVYWLSKFIIESCYSNYQGIIYLDVYSYSGQWRSFTTPYNGCNVKGIYVSSTPNKIYLKLAKPVVYDGKTPDGRFTIYSNFTMTVTTSATAPDGITFTSITSGGTDKWEVNTAQSLKTARTFKVNLASTSASTGFDGSANITDIGVSGTLPVANGGTGVTALSSINLSAFNDNILSGKYLPLSGGTLTGSLTLKGLEIPYIRDFDTSVTSWARAIISIINGSTSIGALGYTNTADAKYLYLGLNGYDGNNLRVYSTGLQFGRNTILHSGNSSVSGQTITINGTSTTWTRDGGAAATAVKLLELNLPSGADLNTYKTPGYYVNSSTAACAAMVNGPSNRTNGEMWFEVRNCGGTGYGLQTYYSRGSSLWLMWTRTYSGSTFSAWVQILHSGNYDSIIDILNLSSLTTETLSVSGAASFTSTISGSINGNAATATLLQNARSITIGNKTLSFNGGSNLTFTLADIGAQGSGNYKPILTAVTAATADTGSTTTFISSVTQDANGVITPKTKTLDTSGTWSGKAGSVDWANTGHPSWIGSSKPSYNLSEIGEVIYGGNEFNPITSGYNNASFWINYRCSDHNNSTTAITDYYIGNGQNKATVAIHAGSFIGNVTGDLTGNVTGNASSASQIKTNSIASNANFYLTFVDSDNGSATAETLYTDGGIYYNPYSNTLNVSGDIHAGSMIYGAANLTSLTVTGGSSVPTQSLGTNNNTIASTAFVRNEVAALVASAPATLDTLNELATALGNDANFSTTMTTALAGKQAKVSAMGSTTKPVYVSADGVFSTCNDYPTKASWNYDDVYLKLVGGTVTGTIITKAGAYTASSSITYPGGGYRSVQSPNFRLIGDPTYGLSTIEFVSLKGDTSINSPSDCAFIQFLPYGTTTLAAVGSAPTLATSGEQNKLIIGVNNDANDEVWLQTPGGSGLKHIVGANGYTIYDAGNFTSGTGATNWCAGNDSRLSNSRNTTWISKTNNAAFPIAFSPNTSPTDSGNGYNTDFTYNPGNYEFKIKNASMKYNSTTGAIEITC